MNAMTNQRVADVPVDTLVASGVKKINCVAGDFLNGITNSIRLRHRNPRSGKGQSTTLFSNLLKVSANKLLRKEGRPCNSST